MSSLDRDKLEEAEALIAWVLAHPGTSRWLRTALQGALERDPIDVLNELEILDRVLRSRAEALLPERPPPRRDYSM